MIDALLHMLTSPH